MAIRGKAYFGTCYGCIHLYAQHIALDTDKKSRCNGREIKKLRKVHTDLRRHGCLCKLYAPILFAIS